MPKQRACGFSGAQGRVEPGAPQVHPFAFASGGR